MSISLEKGSRISLKKAASSSGVSESLSKLVVGLGWDINRYEAGEAFDLDASVFILGADGKVRSGKDFIFYNNPTGEGVIHNGDNRTGVGDGDDEQILINLAELSPEVEKIAFVVTIDKAEERHQNFGLVENAFFHIIDQNTGTELIRYDLTEDYSIETALVVAELYKNKGEWKINAIGLGFTGGLAALCRNYGIDI